MKKLLIILFTFLTLIARAEDKPAGNQPPTNLTIDGWGNSLMNPILGELSKLLPRRTINFRGIGGQTMQQISSRQGGSPVYLSLVSGTAVTGTSSATITPSIQFLTSPATTATQTVTGTILATQSGQIVPVKCVVTRTATGSSSPYTETYSIHLLQGSSTTTTIAANTQFFSDDAFNTKQNINILEMGRNNVASGLTGLDSYIDGCIAWLSPPKQYIVIGVLNQTTETIGTPTYNNIVAANAILAQKYGKYFVPMTPPTSVELAYLSNLGYTPNAQDLADIAAGAIPTGLRNSGDPLHLNSYGSNLIAYRTLLVMQQLGWT